MADSFAEELNATDTKILWSTKQSSGQINYLYKSTGNCVRVIKTPASFARRWWRIFHQRNVRRRERFQ
jgi:hypothetical protein